MESFKDILLGEANSKINSEFKAKLKKAIKLNDEVQKHLKDLLNEEGTDMVGTSHIQMAEMLQRHFNEIISEFTEFNKS